MSRKSTRRLTMNDREYFIDDRVVIPDDIKNMSKEELQQAIEKLEKELNEKKTA